VDQADQVDQVDRANTARLMLDRVDKANMARLPVIRTRTIRTDLRLPGVDQSGVERPLAIQSSTSLHTFFASISLSSM
jgi:hypothetical protein